MSVTVNFFGRSYGALHAPDFSVEVAEVDLVACDQRYLNSV